MDFPRTMYISPGSKKWNRGKTYDTEVVKDQEEYDAAVKAGYTDNFSDALFNPPVVESEDKELTKDEVMELLDSMEVEYNPRDKKAVLLELLEAEMAKKEGE